MNKKILGIGFAGISFLFFILALNQFVLDIENDPYMYVSNTLDIEPCKQTINISIPIVDLYLVLFILFMVIGGILIKI